VTDRKKRFVLRLVIVVILLCTALYICWPLRNSIPFYEQFRKIAILTFRNPLCSFSDAERGLLIQQCLKKNEKLLKNKIRLVNKDSEGYQLWDTPKGHFWLPPNDDLQSFTFILAEQECKIYESGKVGVRDGDIVLDCGAHVGVYTRDALHAGAKLVVAIEPSPQNIECLKRNVKTEVEQGVVIIYEKGVWNREEILAFHTPATGSSASDSFVWKHKNGRTIHVPVTTIDKLVKELKLDRVDFIKMDIEGAEEKALMGAKETITKYGPRIALCVYHFLTFTAYKKYVPQMLNMIKSLYPNYQTQCGVCGIEREREARPRGVFPSVMFFY